MHASKALAKHAYAGEASIVARISVGHKLRVYRGGRYVIQESLNRVYKELQEYVSNI